MTEPSPGFDPRESKKPISVILADDEAAIRDALGDLLSDDPSLEIIATARTGDEAIQLAEKFQPDVVLVDVRMPGGGPSAVERIRKICPDSKILALTAHYDFEGLLDVLRSGACGYLIKGEAPDEIAQKIIWADSGQAVIPRTVMREVLLELFAQLDRVEQLTEEMRALDKIKGELVQVISHELRTPVTILQGSATTLARRLSTLSEEQIANLSTSIESATKRIARTAERVSDSAMMLGSLQPLETTPLLVSEVINMVISELLVEETNRIRFETPGEDPTIWADLVASAKCLAYVIENARDFSPPDSPIDLEVFAHPGRVDIAVLDRGPGVSGDLRASMFDLFTQGDSSTERSHEGIGLGLFIVRRLMELQEGSIRVEDREGGGSKFVLTFPRAMVPVGGDPRLSDGH